MDAKYKRKVGRPPKKNYDAEKQFRELLETVDYIYDINGEIKATAAELEMSPIKVKKLLITSGKLEYDETRQIERLLAYGKSMVEIQVELGLRKSSINSYLPYTKIPYKESEISANADRCNLYRKRKRAIECISDMESLWDCVILFQNYTFYTTSGLKFTYVVKGNEMFISCKEKSVTFSTIEKVYKKVMRDREVAINGDLKLVNGKMVYSRPKDIGDFFGISYIYPIFCRFGLIDVAEKAK